MQPLRVGVIGSFNQDTISVPGQAPRHSLGGILYTLGALAHLGGDAVEVWPLGQVGADIAPLVADFLGGCPGFHLDGLQVVDSPAFHSHIRYFADGQKEERLIGDIGPLEWDDIEPFIDHLDGLLVNFITGFEVRRECLATIRRRSRGPILMDVHSLTLGRHANGRRYWRCPDDWRGWVELADTVQMNQAEATLLSQGQGLRPFAGRVLDLGPQVVVLTLGEEGVLGAWRTPAGASYYQQAANSVDQMVDPTGCGDVFLAGLGVGWALGLEVEQTLLLANRAAGYNCQLQGVGQLQALARLQRPGTC
ncbi:MAG: hypothetical protein GKR89_27685 [Candidatus Latescibacteria bacterium]|nr:hypothetical protein [Candidatus Latescibacterota bacterium]